MKLTDLITPKLNESFGYQNPENDNIHRADPKDTRKPHLTLRMVNRLKKIRATKHLEDLKRNSLLGIMYGSAGGDDGGDF